MEARYTYAFSDTSFNVGPKGPGICFKAISNDFIYLLSVGFNDGFGYVFSELLECFPKWVSTTTFGFGMHFLFFASKTGDIFCDIWQMKSGFFNLQSKCTHYF